MIWEQVKRIIEIYCDEQRKLAFITNNISDYCGVEKKQADTIWYYPAFELRKEYMDKGYPEDTVRIYPSLKSFYHDIIVGKISKFDEYIEKLNTSLNEELKLSIFNGIISQDESALEYSKKIKAILKAKAIAGFNSYGEATNENISILCKVEFLLETNLIEMEDIYVHVDLNERKVIYVE